MRPIVHGHGHGHGQGQGGWNPGPQESPDVWGRPPESPPGFGAGRPPGPGDTGPLRAADPGDPWADEPGPREAYPEQGGPPTVGPAGSRGSGGVEVRLGPRARERERRRQEKAARRSGGRGMLVGAGVLVLAVLVVIGIVLVPGSGGDESETAAGAGGEGGPAVENVELPEAGTPVEVDTADGFQYRLAAVAGGVHEQAPAALPAPPSGMAYTYIDYLLTNPTNDEVLLEYPADVFLKRDLVAPAGQSRCEPQSGVPDDMCTAQTTSEVVQRLAGGELVEGDGGDHYMPAGGTYLVRITVTVPAQSDITAADMGLYVWKQLYMGDQPAQHVPFPG